MSIIITTDKVIASNTSLSNQILVGEIAVKSTKVNNSLVVKTNLKDNFGVCGWSNTQNGNPIPFTLADPITDAADNFT